MILGQEKKANGLKQAWLDPGNKRTISVNASTDIVFSTLFIATTFLIVRSNWLNVFQGMHLNLPVHLGNGREGFEVHPHSGQLH